MVFFLCTVMLTLPLLAHDNTFPTFPQVYDDAQIWTTDLEKLEVTNLKVYQDYISFDAPQFSHDQNIPISEVEVIRVPHGNFAVEGFFLGGLSGLVLPLAATIDNSDNNSSLYITTTLLGAGLGLIIGLASPDYKTIFHTGSFFTATAPMQSFNKDVCKVMPILNIQIKI